MNSTNVKSVDIERPTAAAPDQARGSQEAEEPGPGSAAARAARCSFAELVTAASIVLVHRAPT